ncbi:MAG: hypothetical protein ABIO82_00385 [Ginsengibacter sp.]
MTKRLISILLLAVLLSCNSGSNEVKEEETVVEDTVYEFPATAGGDSAIVIRNSPSLWRAEFEDSTNSYKIYKPSDNRLDTLTVQNLVSLINVDWDSIHLNFEKISHDTMYVAIPDSRYLTQNIGSTGAENYMAATTYSLTELKGVQFVNFRFREGDHASPGVYSRKSFTNYK